MNNVLYTFFSIFLLSGLCLAQDVPRIIAYQGILVDGNGKPITGTKTLTFTLEAKNGLPVAWSETIPKHPINGGLFSVALGLTSTPKGFPTLEGEYVLQVSVDGAQPPYAVPLYSSVSALNIADNVVTERKITINAITTDKIATAAVTSPKIKDGEVTPIKLAQGTTDGQILKWNASTSKWELQSDEGLRSVSVEPPLTGTGTSSNPIKVDIPSSIPVGTIVAYYGEITNTSDIPDGWLLCDGSVIPLGTEYETLRTICSRNGHDGSTPDLRGQFLRGAGITFQNPNNNPDPDFTSRNGGSGTFKIGSVQQDEFKKHSHPFLFNRHERWGSDLYLGIGNGESGTWNGANSSASKSVGLEGTSDETRPKNVAVNWIIKAR